MNKYFEPLQINSAPQKSQPTLDAVQKKFGMIPNLMGNLAYNPESLNAYVNLSSAFSESGLSPLEQQIVAITVSRENNCEYCIAAHSAISKMSNLDEKIISQLRNGESLSDKKLEALRTFTKRIVSAKGWVDSSDLDSFINAGYTKEHILAILIGISMKTLSNYTNHITKTKVDSQFAPFAWSRS